MSFGGVQGPDSWYHYTEASQAAYGEDSRIMSDRRVGYDTIAIYPRRTDLPPFHSDEHPHSVAAINVYKEMDDADVQGFLARANSGMQIQDLHFFIRHVGSTIENLRKNESWRAGYFDIKGTFSGLDTTSDLYLSVSEYTQNLFSIFVLDVIDNEYNIMVIPRCTADFENKRFYAGYFVPFTPVPRERKP